MLPEQKATIALTIVYRYVSEENDKINMTYIRTALNHVFIKEWGRNRSK